MTSHKTHNQEELEAKILRLEHELEVLKQDFKDFSYIVSHDMNAPLRHIDFFTKRLFNNKNGQPLKNSREDKEIIIGAVNKAKNLLSLVHDFSLLATKENAIASEPINLPELTQTIFDSLINEKKIKGARFIQDGLPEYMGDPALIKSLFKHILNNALTYTLPHTPPVIEINADIKNNMLTVLISDNGIGIEEKHFESIFVLLRRAVLDKHYAGKGVGLTMAKKIAHLHGGDLAIKLSKPYNEAESGFHGTVFILTLPVMDS